MDTHDHESCRLMLDSLEALAGDDGEEVDRIIAAHLVTCPIFDVEDRILVVLIAGYARSEMNLPPGLESRLLDRLCPPD